MPLTVESLAAVFGWCAVINSAVLCVFTVALIMGRNWIPSVHARLFSIPASEIKADYFRFLANYKLIIMTFNIVPYVALKLVQ